MRDLLITAIVLGAVPFIFRHAWVGVLMWTWLSIMNPHKLAFGFAHNAQFAALIGGVTLIALITGKDKISLPRNGTVWALTLLLIWMGVTTAFAIYPEDSLNQFEKILKIQLMTFVALAVLHERLHIQLFVWVNAMSVGFYGLKGGLFTIRSGGSERVWGPPGGFIEGNNELGLAMLMVIPLLFYLYATTEHKWVRRGLLLTMLMSAVAVLGTHSRGALLAIMAMGGMLWLRSPVNKLSSGVAILLVGGLLFTFMPSNWHERMGTIRTYEQDSSAMGRINAWETALNIANDRPTGAGFEAYTPLVFGIYAPNPAEARAADPNHARASHSIYFQVLGEHGWIGLFLFLSIWWLVWREAGRLRAQTRGKPDCVWVYQLASMSQVALVGYAVGGAFLSLAYFDLPYNLMVIVLVMRRWLDTQLASTQMPVRSPMSGPVGSGVV